MRAIRFCFELSGTHRTACAVTLQLTAIELRPLRFMCEVKALTLFHGSPQVGWNRKPPVSWQQATD